MVNLWYDIQIALNAGLRLVHLTAEPVSVADVSRQGFGKAFDQKLPGTPAAYDLRTRHSNVFGAQGAYQYSVRETIQAIRAYAQSEPVTLETCVWSDCMRMAISNIAWDVAEDEVIAQLLDRYGIDAVDVAPGKYFPDPANASDDDIKRVRDWWAERGIEITGMQALLFGTSGLNVFGSSGGSGCAACASGGRLPNRCRPWVRCE